MQAPDILGATSKTTLVQNGITSIVATFSTVGTSTCNIQGLFSSFDILVVGGGGGGGGGISGGGGAGGAVYRTGLRMNPGALSVTVGNGGIGGSTNGGDSSFFGFTGIGGGRGANILVNGFSGGCGGGGYGDPATGGGAGLQGGRGGDATNQNVAGGGGGGMGGDGGGTNGGAGRNAGIGGFNGGPGIQNSITGTAVFYAGGGGGAGTNAAGGLGGSGGGGAGGQNVNGTAGTNGLGGGGGNGANGGSGVVIVRGYLPTQTIPPQMIPSNQTVITQTASFLGTGAVQTWPVPAGVFNVKFFLWGSGGVGQNGGNFQVAGSGAFVEGNLVTTPGTTYSIIVGRPGQAGLENGGGTTGGTSAGGGGFSGIFSGSPAANTVLAIAGAGGGSGFNGNGVGGGGGYPTGRAGVGGGSQGGGGTQSAGGTSFGTAAAQFAGGNGAGGDGGGGGGGGGFYGGGGGTGQGAGGGGSSTYTTLVINPATQNGNNGGTNGSSAPLPGGTNSPYWISPYGSAGQNGLVVIGYSIIYSSQNIYSYKYVKFTVFLTRGGMSGANPEFQLSEFQLKIRGVFVDYTGITISPNTTGAEGSIRVIDGNVNTKYFAVSQGNSFTIISPSSFTFDSYTWATANDASSRDPVRWRVEGSTDNTNWVILDDKSTVTQNVTESRFTYLPDIQLPSSSPPSYSLMYRVPTESLLQAFTSNGSVQSYTVPAGVTTIKIYLWGAGGGNANTGGGGGGGFVSGAARVTPGEILYIVVGAVNTAGAPSLANGGGGGIAGKYYGGGGGGFSGVFRNATPQQGYAICMAGGGGSGNNTSANNVPLAGGPGGYPNGYQGQSASGRTGATGGTQTGAGTGAASGSAMFGGNGSTTASDDGYVGGAGSGGGGWFGGGASIQNRTNAGGGGGSGFIGGFFGFVQTQDGSYPATPTGVANAGGESNPYWVSPLGRSTQNGYVVITRFQM